MVLATACYDCGAPTDTAVTAIWDFARNASDPGIDVQSVGSVRGHQPNGEGWYPHASSSQHVFALHLLMSVLGSLAMASRGGYYAQAASSSLGGDPAPGWNAADSLQQLAAARARQWRANEGLERDEDFAYAYLDYDHRVGVAGHDVADDWLATRARVEEGLLHAGAMVLEGRPPQTGAIWPLRTTIMKARTLAVTKPQDAIIAASQASPTCFWESFQTWHSDG